MLLQSTYEGDNIIPHDRQYIILTIIYDMILVILHMHIFLNDSHIITDFDISYLYEILRNPIIL